MGGSKGGCPQDSKSSTNHCGHSVCYGIGRLHKAQCWPWYLSNSTCTSCSSASLSAYLLALLASKLACVLTLNGIGISSRASSSKKLPDACGDDGRSKVDPSNRSSKIGSSATPAAVVPSSLTLARISHSSISLELEIGTLCGCAFPRVKTISVPT